MNNINEVINLFAANRSGGFVQNITNDFLENVLLFLILVPIVIGIEFIAKLIKERKQIDTKNPKNKNSNKKHINQKKNNNKK